MRIKGKLCHAGGRAGIWAAFASFTGLLLLSSISNGANPTEQPFQKGDEVVVNHDVPVYFYDKVDHTAVKGEKITVFQHNTEKHCVYFLSKDPSGKQIALRIDEAALEKPKQAVDENYWKSFRRTTWLRYQAMEPHPTRISVVGKIQSLSFDHVNAKAEILNDGITPTRPQLAKKGLFDEKLIQLNASYKLAVFYLERIDGPDASDWVIKKIEDFDI